MHKKAHKQFAEYKKTKDIDIEGLMDRALDL